MKPAPFPDFPPDFDPFAAPIAEGILARSRTTRVFLAKPAGDHALVVKVYEYPRLADRWRMLPRGALWGTPPALREARHLAMLSAHDPPLAPRVLWVRLERRFGVLRRAAIGMEALENHRNLVQVLPEASADAARRMQEALLGALQDLAAFGFRHRDLFARNVLIDPRAPEASVRFVDCRKGRRLTGASTLHQADARDLLLDLEKLALGRRRHDALWTYLQESAGLVADQRIQRPSPPN